MGKYWLIFVNNKNNPLLSGLVVSVSISLFNQIGISTDKVLLIVPLIFLKIARVNGAPTIAKITKLVYVYNCLDMSLIGEFSTVNCSKHFKIGKDTLTKYIKNGVPYKGKIFSR